MDAAIQNLTEADKAGLRKLAAKASSGEWRIDRSDARGTSVGTNHGTLCERFSWEPDTEYVVAAQPIKVIALLDEITRLERERDEAREEIADRASAEQSATRGWVEQTERAARLSAQLAKATTLLRDTDGNDIVTWLERRDAFLSTLTQAETEGT